MSGQGREGIHEISFAELLVDAASFIFEYRMPNKEFRTTEVLNAVGHCFSLRYSAVLRFIFSRR
jgi:hypothetical protein